MVRDMSLHKSASFFDRMDNSEGLQSALKELHTVHHGGDKGDKDKDKGKAAIKKQRQGKLPFGMGGSKELAGAVAAPQDPEKTQDEDVNMETDRYLHPNPDQESDQDPYLDPGSDQDEAQGNQENVRPVVGRQADRAAPRRDEELSASPDPAQPEPAQPPASKLARFRAQQVSA